MSADVSLITSEPPALQPTEKTLSSNTSQPFVFDPYQKKSSEIKPKRKRQIIDDNSIPLALATSLHSNISLYNENDFLSKYIQQLFTNNKKVVNKKYL